MRGCCARGGLPAMTRASGKKIRCNQKTCWNPLRSRLKIKEYWYKQINHSDCERERGKNEGANTINREATRHQKISRVVVNFSVKKCEFYQSGVKPRLRRRGDERIDEYCIFSHNSFCFLFFPPPPHSQNLLFHSPASASPSTKQPRPPPPPPYLSIFSQPPRSIHL